MAPPESDQFRPAPPLHGAHDGARRGDAHRRRQCRRQSGNVNLDKIRRDERLSARRQVQTRIRASSKASAASRARRRRCSTRAATSPASSVARSIRRSAQLRERRSPSPVCRRPRSAAPPTLGRVRGQCQPAQCRPISRLIARFRAVAEVGPGATPQKNLAISGAYTPAISNKVSATATLGFTASQSESLLGLPGATLRLPAGNPFSPFSRDVQLLRYYDDQSPLARSSDSRTRRQSRAELNGDSRPGRELELVAPGAATIAARPRSVTDTGVDPVAMQALLDARDAATSIPLGAIPASLIRQPSVQTLANSRSGERARSTSRPMARCSSCRRAMSNVTVRVAGQRPGLSTAKSSIAGLFQPGRHLARQRQRPRQYHAADRPAAGTRVLDAIGDLVAQRQFRSRAAFRFRPAHHHRLWIQLVADRRRSTRTSSVDDDQQRADRAASWATR